MSEARLVGSRRMPATGGAEAKRTAGARGGGGRCAERSEARDRDACVLGSTMRLNGRLRPCR